MLPAGPAVAQTVANGFGHSLELAWATKAAARQHLRARRDDLSVVDRRVATQRAGLAIDQALTHLRENAVVAAYRAVGSELDLGPSLARLRARGVRIAYPHTRAGRGQPLAFAFAHPAELALTPLGLYEPRPDATPCPLDTIDACLVPALGFDHAGVRLGYGGGYYDRTLPLAPRARRLGVAFACQHVPALPHEPHDVPMHVILTDHTA